MSHGRVSRRRYSDNNRITRRVQILSERKEKNSKLPKMEYSRGRDGARKATADGTSAARVEREIVRSMSFGFVI